MGDYAITRYRGDTKAIGITVTKDGLPLDITDYTFKLTVNAVKDPVPADTPLFTLIGEIVSAVAGQVKFPMTVQQADNLGKYYYDVEMTDDAGEIKTIGKDNFTWTQDITK